MEIEIRRASSADVDTVSSILLEAANWLQERGMPMWRANELLSERIAEDVAQGLFFLGEHTGEPAGTIKFQLSDPEFWPDVPEDASAFIHMNGPADDDVPQKHLSRTEMKVAVDPGTP